MGIKELLLNKGWAGRTITRPETAERLDPIIRGLNELMFAYAAASDRLEATAQADLETAQKVLRADIGKLNETVFSAGGTPFNGTSLKMASFQSDDQSDALIRSLLDREVAFGELIEGELDIEHHMRTRAVLAAVAQNSAARRQVLGERKRR